MQKAVTYAQTHTKYTMKSTGDKNNCLYKDVILFAGPNINHEGLTYQQEKKTIDDQETSSSKR
jgi:hypothetical protein